jgi:hypothetical protein
MLARTIRNYRVAMHLRLSLPAHRLKLISFSGPVYGVKALESAPQYLRFGGFFIKNAAELAIDVSGRKNCIPEETLET